MAEPACQGAPLAGGSHGGPVAAIVRVCPAGHMRAGWACEACQGGPHDGAAVAVCLECPRAPQALAILIPADAFRAAPFGSVMARLREMDTELAMASEVPGGS